MDKKFLNALAMVALVIVAGGTLANFLLSKFGADIDLITYIVNLVTHIITLLAFFFVAVYAYAWVKTTPKRKRLAYQILYACCVIVIVVFYVLKYLP